MGLARIIYSLLGNKLKLQPTLLLSGSLCVLCYLIAGLSSMPILALIGCALCGFTVGILWPGVLSLSANKIPNGGTMMFALLAVAGDVGCTIGPSLTGTLSNIFDGNLQIGLLFGTIFPIIFVVLMLISMKISKNQKHNK